MQRATAMCDSDSPLAPHPLRLESNRVLTDDKVTEAGGLCISGVPAATDVSMSDKFGQFGAQ
jgi:hypothetical protein